MEGYNFENALRGKISKSFHLFDGFRSKEEDQEILDKVIIQCLYEAVGFLGENLSEKEQEDFFSRVQGIERSNQRSKEKQQQLSDLLSVTFSGVPDYQFKLECRLDSFIDNLLVESLKAGSEE